MWKNILKKKNPKNQQNKIILSDFCKTYPKNFHSIMENFHPFNKGEF